MTFKYQSTYGGFEKEVPVEISNQIHDHLINCGFKPNAGSDFNEWTFGDLQDHLMSFRTRDGKRPLMNLLMPIFLHVAMYGELWNKE